MPPQQPVELIVARNLIAMISLAAFLVDAEGTLLFFNTAAEALIGQRFEDVGPLTPGDWTEDVGPFDELGKLIPIDALPMTQALREGLPANGSFRARLGGDELTEVEASGLPLVGKQGFHGAIIVFWRAIR